MWQLTSSSIPSPWHQSRVSRARRDPSSQCILHSASIGAQVLLLVGALYAAGCAGPTPTPAAPTPPPGWVSYTSPDGFMIYHPPTWRVCREAPPHTIFCLPDDASFAIGLYTTKCDFASDCSNFLDCASRLIDEGLDPSRTRKEISRGTWTTGPTCGCVLEDVVRDQSQRPTYFMQVFLPVEDGRIVVATYYHSDAETLTGAERKLVTEVIKTLQPAGSGRLGSAHMTESSHKLRVSESVAFCLSRHLAERGGHAD